MILCAIGRLAVVFLVAGQVFAEAEIQFSVGTREIVATAAQRESLGLNWFVDGNLGVVKDGEDYRMYGANGPHSFRITGTELHPFEKAEPVTIVTKAKNFGYLSGGPVFRDPSSGRLLLFYHAEIHRGTEKNFYAVLGLAIQTDCDGLEFQDLGPIFSPNVPNEYAKKSIELCGAPYVIKDGCFYVYARDAMMEVKPRQSNLSVARAKVKDVVERALEGKSAVWQKYYKGAFSEPALGGRSTPLECGNPTTRWMDVSYNVALHKFIMVVAANTMLSDVNLFISFSDDGIQWTEREHLTHEDGESFYVSVVGLGRNPRQTGNEFYVYYTSSKKGGWERWSDSDIVRRKITLKREQ